MTLCRLAATLLLPAVLSTPALAHDGPHVVDAYARASAQSGAVFFVIENHSASPDRLLSAASDVAQRVELHTHEVDAAGVARMVPIENGIPVAGHGSHALARGGDHVMLMGLTRPLRDGDTFPLTLTFARGEVVEVEVTVDNGRAPAAGTDAADHGHHGGHASP